MVENSTIPIFSCYGAFKLQIRNNKTSCMHDGDFIFFTFIFIRAVQAADSSPILNLFMCSNIAIKCLDNLYQRKKDEKPHVP